MRTHYNVIALIIATMLLLTACSSGGQVKEDGNAERSSEVAQSRDGLPQSEIGGSDGEDMVRSYTQISQDEAKQMMEQDGTQIIVDVRTQEEYDAGHIPGAVCIPNESIGTEQPEELPDLDQVILIYCRSGNRSKQAAQKLFDMGYTNIYEFGGINDWTGEVVTDEPAVNESAEKETLSEENTKMQMMIDKTEVPVTWEENASVEALRNLLPLTIQMSMYGGFEQVGPIGQNIVSEDVQTTTDYGDIVLYSGDQIVVFYGSNSWAYTRLGHVDLSRKEMEDLLGNEDVVITIRMKE